MSNHRPFGTIRKLPSGGFQVRYPVRSPPCVDRSRGLGSQLNSSRGLSSNTCSITMIS